MNDALIKAIELAYPRALNYRRDFHRFAESGWTEFRTASLIARRLHELGFTVLSGKEVVSEPDRMGLPTPASLTEHFNRAIEQGADPEYAELLRGGFTGVVGLLNNGVGPVVALRFDIDALDVCESTATTHRPAREGFASVNNNVMHACGHDTHAATGLGLAEVLIGLKDKLRGTLKLVFQPAEEGVRGAKAMVAAGLFDDVDFLIGHHVMPGWGQGEIVCGMGGYSATKKFDVTFDGLPAHAGGSPHKGKNAMLAAANAVLNLHAISRHGKGETRVNVGKLESGTGRNVIPSFARLVCEVRGEDSELCDFMYNSAVRVLRASAEMQGCGVEIVPMGEARSGNSDKELAERVKKTAMGLGGYRFFELEKSGGCEDITFMMERVRERGGQATNIGIGADLCGIRHEQRELRDKVLGAHTSVFDVEERAMADAMRIIAANVLDIMRRD